MRNKIKKCSFLDLASILCLLPLVAPADEARKDAAWGSPVSGIQMSISLAPAANNTNTAPTIVVRYKNLTSQDRFVWRKGVDDLPSLKLTITSDSGKNLSLPWTPDAGPFGTALVFLEPGEERQFLITRTNLASMRAPGTYTVIAKHKVGRLVKGSGEVSSVELVSNPLQLEVREQPKHPEAQ